MLTQQLKELALDEIVERTVLRQVPPHVEYHLTAHGRSLNGILSRMATWGVSIGRSTNEQGSVSVQDCRSDQQVGRTGLFDCPQYLF